MYDIALDESGDIIFQQDTSKANPLKIQFNVTNGKAFKINFQTQGFNPLEQSSTALKISFNMDKKENNKKALVLNENDATVQAIKIRIQTTVGDIAGRLSLGSQLELIKHQRLYNSTVQQNAITMVKTAISDILPNAEVRVQPTISKSSNGYSQRLSIYIYDDDLLIFKYEL